MGNRRGGSAGQRNDRLIQEHEHNPYRLRKKPREPVACAVCGAVFQAGRWQWAERAPGAADSITCEACQRIADVAPAGEVRLGGSFAAANRQDLIGLARNEADQECAEHPLNRILDIAEAADAIVIRTTDVHLPHRIGRAVQKAYKGALDTHYDEEGYFARVTWSRET